MKTLKCSTNLGTWRRRLGDTSQGICQKVEWTLPGVQSHWFRSSQWYQFLVLLKKKISLPRKVSHQQINVPLSIYCWRNENKSPCNCMNAGDNTASCWKKATRIIRLILVVFLQLPAIIYRAARAFLAPKSSSLRSQAFYPISHQPGWLTSCNTGLAHLM